MRFEMIAWDHKVKCLPHKPGDTDGKNVTQSHSLIVNCHI